MRAVIQERYGTAADLRVGELPDPVPAEGEVLVRVKAVSLNGSDRENLAGSPAYSRIGGIRRPRHPVPGSDIAGVVAAVGAGVGGFRPGDEVFGELAGYRGGLAEYVATPPKLLARKPSELSFVEAAAIPQAGCIAYRATRGVRPGDKVLVNGAGGAGGAFVVALAKHCGAEVTAVDSAAKASYLLRIGADAVIGYESEDWADRRDAYDRVIDLVAERPPYRVHRALRPRGSYLMIGGHARILLATLVAGAPIGWAVRKRVRVLAVPQSREDLEAVTALVVEGSAAPVIDRVFPLEEAPAAFAKLAAGEQRGKVVIEIA
ncbi:MAG TPA: NAD(P)-dependent alcohol dehydrogenase [Glycomyces sp.]